MLETLGESFALIRKYGIAPEQFLEVLTGSLFPAPVYQNYGALIAQQKYRPAGFRLVLGLKDVRLALAAAEEAQAPMPIASLLRDNALSAVAQGLGDNDWAVLALVAAQRAGLK
jgi:3-hydroxyisobutyrate dehydrogenase-like beta-hydroxyacid dehydrogenase